MKKLLVALAAIGVIATAQAQSVTVYGIVDAAVRAESNGNADTKTSVLSGVQSTSRIGFMGSEDLGGGRAAKFKLESGFAPTTGANSQNGSTGTVLFDRFAYVGVADSKLGEVQLGRNTTATYDLAATVTDPLAMAGDGIGAPVNAIAGTRAVQSITFAGNTSGYKNTRSDGMIKYTNTFGPVAVTAGYAAGGVAGSDQKSSYSGNAVYTVGPLTVGAGAFRAIDAADKQLNSNSVGAKYALGDFTFTASRFNQRTDAGYVGANLTTATTYTGPLLGGTTTAGTSTDSDLNVFGVKYKITPALSATLAAYRGDYSNGTGSKGTIDSNILFTEYTLSKRTNLYAMVDFVKTSGAMASTTITGSNTGITTGIRHSF